jgi:hypothetical protein
VYHISFLINHDSFDDGYDNNNIWYTSQPYARGPMIKCSSYRSCDLLPTLCTNSSWVLHYYQPYHHLYTYITLIRCALIVILSYTNVGVMYSLFVLIPILIWSIHLVSCSLVNIPATITYYLYHMVNDDYSVSFV